MQFTVKQARTYAGLTQEELANALEIARCTYSHIEKDPSRATVHQLNRIAEVTGIPVEYIFLGLNSTKVAN